MAQHSTKIIDILLKIDNSEKQICLLKTIIGLVLRSPEELCAHNEQLFQKLFNMINNQNNQAIVENILWLQSSLLELQISEQQLELAINVCLKYNTVQIFVSCLDSSEERVLLEALRGITTLTSISEFREQLFADKKLNNNLFAMLAKIINQIKEQKFTQYMIEIETSLTEVLSLITEQGDDIEDQARK